MNIDTNKIIEAIKIIEKKSELYLNRQNNIKLTNDYARNWLKGL